MRYGTPYKGSKNAICDRLAEAVPWKGISNFYDLFAGGCAMTHRMLLGGRYAHCHANDMDGQGLRLFMNAASGKYRDEKRWISREDFDHGAFYNWCCSQSELVLVSEYQMPEDRFEPVLSLEKTSLLSQKGADKKVTERLYVPRHQLETYRRLMHEQNKPRYIEMNLFGQQDY